MDPLRMIANALVVGGGIGGMTTAVALQEAGVAVDLIDADPEWRVYGAGISLTGISLRAFNDLGVLDEIRARGFVSAGMRSRLQDGRLLMEMVPPDITQPVQQTGGILRPILHSILSARVRRTDVAVRLGVKVKTLEQDGAGVDVGFDDGRSTCYDLVVAADGINSQIRSMIFPDAKPPQFTGQGCWRVVAKRPADIDRVEMYFGGTTKLGINPVSQDEMYLFILEHVPHNPRFSEAEMVAHVRDLMAPYGGAIPEVREHTTLPSQINYRPLEWHLLPDPWWRGRVVVIGDAAHSTTPHLASGAGVAAEDGLVLARELARHDDIATALQSFMRHRYERARLVVENSIRIGEMEMAGADAASTFAIYGQTMGPLQEPY